MRVLAVDPGAKCQRQIGPRRFPFNRSCSRKAKVGRYCTYHASRTSPAVKHLEGALDECITDYFDILEQMPDRVLFPVSDE